MDGASSIWDIYNNSKRLLPLSSRMDNRRLREESSRVQHTRRRSSADQLLDPDVIMDDGDTALLTPLSTSVISSSPNSTKATRQSNRGGQKGNNTTSMRTPMSMSSESPNSVTNQSSTTSTSSVNGTKKHNDVFQELSVQDFLDFKNDAAFASGLDFDIMKELDRVKQDGKLIFQPKEFNVKSQPSVMSSNENVMMSKDTVPDVPQGISPQSTLKNPARPKETAPRRTPAATTTATTARPTPNVSKETSKSISKCSNCGTTKTPLWRKDSEGNTLCNACGLFQKLHGTMRPLSLKTDVIKKRNSKRQASNGPGGRKGSSSHVFINGDMASSAPSTHYRQGQFQMQSGSPNAFASQSYQFTPIASKQSFRQQQYHQGQSPQVHTQQFQIQPQHHQDHMQRSKNVPILPKPSSRGSNPNTPSTPTACSPSSSLTYSPVSQPQDIPQFKRRKSRLNLSSSHGSQSSSPMTATHIGSVGYSPSAYSPMMNIPSPGQQHSASASRKNSVSSMSSGGLYHDINSKRGLASSYNSFGSLSNRNIAPMQTTSVNQPGATNMGTSVHVDNPHFSNLSAGINAIRQVKPWTSGLSKSVVVNPSEAKRQPSENSKTSLNDLDWLKFDI